jgi:ATP/maltotriose-dependent transcriptional regulator MalT
MVATGSIDEADRFLQAHEELALRRGRRVTIARLARARGRVEAAAGRELAAEKAFQAALDVIDGIDVPFERARIELAAGKFLRHGGRRRQAADLLADARGRFLALGALPYANRCAQEMVASGFDPGQARSGGQAGLTSQELVVAHLAAGGRSNRELADELVVSIKTIEFHLRNIFVKLGINSRRQLPDRLADMRVSELHGGVA